MLHEHQYAATSVPKELTTLSWLDVADDNFSGMIASLVSLLV
jgi:hypothetical protein